MGQVNLSLYDMEQPLALSKMEIAGIKVKKAFDRDADEILKRFSAGEFNINSPKQLGELT